MSDQISDGNRMIECREVQIGKHTMPKAAESYARNEYPDCDVLISNQDDGHGGRILLFTKSSQQMRGNGQ